MVGTRRAQSREQNRGPSRSSGLADVLSRKSILIPACLVGSRLVYPSHSPSVPSEGRDPEKPARGGGHG